MLSLNAPASSLSLSESSSDIQFGDEPSSLKHTLRRLLTQKLLFCPAIMTKLEQVVAHCKAILFQLVIAGLFMDQFVCIYQTSVGIISQVEFASHSVSYGKFMSSQGGQ
jgi:hypothetical protein